MSTKKEFETTQREVEKKFEEFLESIPDWRDRLASIIIQYGYGFPKEEDLGSLLIPRIKDLDYQDPRVSFKIRIPGETWVPSYITISWFPLEWLTSPESNPISQDYLTQKLARREKRLKDLEKDRQGILSELDEVTMEISKIKELLKGE